MNRLIEMVLQVQKKHVIIKIPQKYCIKCKDIKEGQKAIYVTTGGFGSPRDENYEYAIDLGKIQKEGFEDALYLTGFGDPEKFADCIVTAVPNEKDDSFGVMIVDKISNEDLYKWARGAIKNET